MISKTPLTREIMHYCHSLSRTESEESHLLRRRTHLETLNPNMSSSQFQGNLIAMICAMIRPQSILELGTFTGYATLSMAETIGDDARITTIETNPELEYIIQETFESSIHSEKLQYLIGDAKDLISTLTDSYDFIYIDAGKTEYSQYYDLLFDKWSIGGFMLVDNVLWYGKVIENQKDAVTAAIDAFNQKVHEDHRTTNLIIPIDDGLNLIQKIKTG